MSCVVAALLAEANSIKQDYADIVSADYPNLKTLEFDLPDYTRSASRTFQSPTNLSRSMGAAAKGIRS